MASFSKTTRHQSLEPLAQDDAQSLREEGHEQVRFDPLGSVMVDGPKIQVALLGAERFLDEDQLHVATTNQLRVVGAEVGAQQIPALPVAQAAQFLPVEGEGEFPFARHGGWRQSGGDASGPIPGRPAFLQPWIAGEVLGLQLLEPLPVVLQFAPTHGAFLVESGAACGQHIHFPSCGSSLTRNWGRTSCQDLAASSSSGWVSRPLGVPTR